jgi:Predicted lipase
MQPNFTRDAVYHAERFPAFVEHQASWCFDPEAQGLSLVNAWWLCNLSHLVYYDEADAEPVLQRMGLTLEAFIDDRKEQDSQDQPIKDTQALIVSNDEAVMLVFRGTEQDVFKDVLTDAYFMPVDFPGRGRVHAGFYHALSGDCWRHILDVLERPGIRKKPLWITGHSLGAALATMAAAYLEPTGVYNFGSPRVGDAAFCASLAGLNFQRFVNCSDVVPQVPLKVWLGFQHTGTLQYFDAGGTLYTQPGKTFIERDRFKARWLYPLQAWPVPLLNDNCLLRSFADHAVLNYAYGIWKNLRT